MTRLHLAANQGLVGGGEVMLLRTAAKVRELGLPVTVVAPAHPGETLRSARQAGFDTVPIEGSGRVAYARRLRRWDRHREGVLWCHGLLPSLATAGHPRRVVHLHQLPTGPSQGLSMFIARRRALVVLVPSAYLAGLLPGTRILSNWTDAPVRGRADRTGRDGQVLGFLGRQSQDKGLDVLADAVAGLADEAPSSPRLLMAGDSRFVPQSQRRVVGAALARLAGRVEQPGWIERDDFFDAVDIVVVPSVFPESFGLAVAEGMAAGVPCVISDAGALPEVAGPEHPWVAAAGDAAALARVLRAALDDDTSPVVDRARRRWETEYSPAAGRARVAALLCDLGLRVQEHQS